MFGRLAAAARMAVGLRGAKEAFSEIRDVIVAVRTLAATYEDARSDGQITPEECERIMLQLGVVARQGMEAKLQLERFF